MWRALSTAEITARVEQGLRENISWHGSNLLGYPASAIDGATFGCEDLAQAWLNVVQENPNHIGCHTLEVDGESAWRGTQAIEREVIQICADLLQGEHEEIDGYVGAGGTESNIQALRELRNLWRRQGASRDEIGVLCSADTHYSVHKAAELMDLPVVTVAVDEATRAMTPAALEGALDVLVARGMRHVAVVLNMGTTMFGSVDDPEPVYAALDKRGLNYLVHVDAAFGGFVLPFTRPSDVRLGFRDARVASVTLDGHKMLGAPYGTGIHLVRRGLLEHTATEAATYVPGGDRTLCGSRSGANAVALWMILARWGFEGRAAFVRGLVERTERLAAALGDLQVEYIMTPGMNMLAIRDSEIPRWVSAKYALVPDDHASPVWRKVIVAEHVTDALLDRFLGDLRALRFPCL